MAIPFLDTNILLRHLLQDDRDFSPRATALLSRVEAGDLTVRTSDIVVFETVFTLQRIYKQSPQAIAAALLPLIELAGILLPGKRQYRQVFDLYAKTALGFADSYHVALMRRLGISDSYSLDQGLDGIPGINRVDP
jgi:predicted nucleic acid-binding protein